MADTREGLVWAIAAGTAALFLGGAAALVLGPPPLAGPVLLFLLSGAAVGLAFLCGSRYGQARRGVAQPLFSLIWPPVLAFCGLIALVAPIQAGPLTQALALGSLIVLQAVLVLLDRHQRPHSVGPRLLASGAIVLALVTALVKVSAL